MILEILRKQNELDVWLGKGKRTRNVTDICFSAIAECIELNEEFENEYRHKTWKPKEFNLEKRNKELVDIFFFISQLINNSVDLVKNEMFLMNLESTLKDECDSTNEDFDTNPNKELSRLMNILSNLAFICSISSKHESYIKSCVIEDLTPILRVYGRLCFKLGVNFETLTNLYNDKLEENFNREDFKKAVAGGLCE